MQIKRDWAACGSERSGGSVALLFCLGRTLIRHTQQQRLGGQVVSQLPAKTEAAVPSAPHARSCMSRKKLITDTCFPHCSPSTFPGLHSQL
jgi:hypothetical protein